MQWGYLQASTARNTEDVIGEDQFGFRRGTGTRDVIGIKVRPITGHEGSEGEWRYSLYSFFNLGAR
jgi:hypothetical protein